MADGNEEVGGLVGLWGESLVGDVKAFSDVGESGAFGFDFAVLSDADGGVMVGDISVVVDEDHVICAAFLADVFFGEDVRADHASGFADVEEFWPVPIALKLVGGEAPFSDGFSEVDGDARVV